MQRNCIRQYIVKLHQQVSQNTEASTSPPPMLATLVKAPPPSQLADTILK